MEEERLKQQVKKLEKENERLKAGVWQYLLDHAFLTFSGAHRVSFVIRDQQSFWWRVKARISGEYRAVKVEEAEMLADELRAKRKQYGFVQYEDIRHHEIRQRGTWKEKVMLYAYDRIRKKLFNENHHNVSQSKNKKVGDGERN